MIELILGVIDMKFKKVLVVTAMVGVLATGVVGYGNQHAKVYFNVLGTT